MMIWLVALIILLVIEMIRMNVTSLCIAVGVLTGIILAAFSAPVWAQVAAFVAVSAILLVAVRPVVAKYFHKEKKNIRNDRLVGADAIVLCEIDNSEGVGLVNIAGKEWRAEAKRASSVIPVGSVAKVVAVRGDKVVVDDMVRSGNNR